MRRWIMAISAVASIVCLIVIGYCYNEKKQYDNQTYQVQKKIDKINHNHNLTKDQLNKKHYTNTSDEAMNATVNQFFHEMFGYTSGKNYLLQRQKAIKLVDSSQFNDKKLDKLYSTGIDSTGSNMIDKLGQKSSVTDLSSYSLNDDFSECNVLVQYMVQNNGSGPHTGYAWYQVKLDQKTDKIIDLEKIDTLSKLS